MYRGSPLDYLAHTIRAVVDSVPGIDEAQIEDVIVGTGFPEGCQGMNAARIAAMAAGLPLRIGVLGFVFSTTDRPTRASVDRRKKTALCRACPPQITDA